MITLREDILADKTEVQAKINAGRNKAKNRQKTRRGSKTPGIVGAGGAQLHNPRAPVVTTPRVQGTKNAAIQTTSLNSIRATIRLENNTATNSMC
mmetsp:Transcript_34064/g.39716  ORF Transcript_34064/g.39716 Transcript_34064/m.39716 type:complete len:95 (+) Transcript_34064:393-677(+)